MGSQSVFHQNVIVPGPVHWVEIQVFWFPTMFPHSAQKLLSCGVMELMNQFWLPPVVQLAPSDLVVKLISSTKAQSFPAVPPLSLI